MKDAYQEQLEFEALKERLYVLTPSGKTVDIAVIPSDVTVICIISCGARKRDYKSKARDLYRSGLFSLSRQVADTLGDVNYVMSARYGLVAFNEYIEPYDMNLSSLSSHELEHIQDNIEETLQRLHALNAQMTILFFGSQKYFEIIRCVADKLSIPIAHPLRGLGLFERTSLLRKLSDEYAWLAICKRMQRYLATSSEVVNIIPFADFPKHKGLPLKGVYFFLDPEQRCPAEAPLGQIVRVGTHGVSRGSKATLRQRLRAHFGTAAGFGNHRSSVFRLHVGRSLIHRAGCEHLFPLWGNSAISPKEAPANEREIEAQVSDYIRNLSLFVIPLEGEACATNSRAELERLCISSFSAYWKQQDRVNSHWLGHSSPHPTVSRAQLWNVAYAKDLPTAQDVSLLSRLLPL